MYLLVNESTMDRNIGAKRKNTRTTPIVTANATSGRLTLAEMRIVRAVSESSWLITIKMPQIKLSQCMFWK